MSNRSLSVPHRWFGTLILLFFVSGRAWGQEAEADSVPRYVIDEPVRSTASEMTLREIIQRAVEGERTKLAGHRNMTYNASVRSILTWKKKREIRDQIFLVYEDDREVHKHVQLVEKVKKYKLEDEKWVLKPEDDDEGNVEVRMEAGTRGEDLGHIPFFLRNQEDYDFTLVERNLEGEHVIFKIQFEPRSRFKPLPSGTVYVDTDNFRVIHEEFRFDENPVPLIVKDIKRFSRQWTELPGGQWVVSKVMGELSLQGGWTGVIPERVEIGVVFNDYRFDQGYDEHRFGAYGK